MERYLAMIILVVFLLTTCCALATEVESEFDISVDTSNVEELGIPTVSIVSKMKSEADNLWKEANYAEAAIAYGDYAKQVNWLANLIASGDEPYYSGDSDERKSFYKSEMYSIAASAEKKANSYKSERNRAMTYEALCYYNLGDYTTAVPLFVKALELIEIEDTTNWKLCTDALYDIIGFKP